MKLNELRVENKIDTSNKSIENQRSTWYDLFEILDREPSKNIIIRENPWPLMIEKDYSSEHSICGLAKKYNLPNFLVSEIISHLQLVGFLP